MELNGMRKWFVPAAVAIGKGVDACLERRGCAEERQLEHLVSA
jgi:hypothetical protein